MQSSGSKHLLLALFAVGLLTLCQATRATSWCDDGLWADAMIGSHHIRPKQSFKQFNPGLGVECWPGDTWGVTAGGFRNSLARPSYYGGALWSPDFARLGPLRVGVMAGIISGYNFGRWGLTHSLGPVIAPLLMADFRHIGINLILIPPIPADNLPFTVGLQLKVRFN
jgi:hypothetical protein